MGKQERKDSSRFRLGEPYNICAHGAVDTRYAYCQDNEGLQQQGHKVVINFQPLAMGMILRSGLFVLVGVGLVTATTAQKHDHGD